MKTIRTDCFETNSSSTHSVTIRSKSTHVKDPEKQLIIDGILYPGNLRYSSAYRSDERDGYVLVASDPAEKASLVFHHLGSLANDGETTSGEEISKKEAKVLTDLLTLRLVEAGVCEGVDPASLKESSWFSHWTEDSDLYLDEIIESDERSEALDMFITHTILNNDMVMTDVESGY